jgi:hypothetical protein
VHPRATAIETHYSAVTASGDPMPQYTPKGDKKRQHRPVNAILPPEAITGGRAPRSMVSVRLAGAEVSEGFLTSAAGCPDPAPLATSASTSRPRSVGID